jgi:hypothetical protein
LKDAAVLLDAVSETFEASTCVEVIDGSVGSCPTREYLQLAGVFAWALFFWKTVKSDAAPRMIGIY